MQHVYPFILKLPSQQGFYDTYGPSPYMGQPDASLYATPIHAGVPTRASYAVSSYNNAVVCVKSCPLLQY